VCCWFIIFTRSHNISETVVARLTFLSPESGAPLYHTQ